MMKTANDMEEGWIRAISRYFDRKIAARFWQEVVLPLVGKMQKYYPGAEPWPQVFAQRPLKELIDSLFVRGEQGSFTNLDVAVALYRSTGRHLVPGAPMTDALINASALTVKYIIEAIWESPLYKWELKRLGKDYENFSYLVHRDIVRAETPCQATRSVVKQLGQNRQLA